MIWFVALLLLAGLFASPDAYQAAGALSIAMLAGIAGAIWFGMSRSETRPFTAGTDLTARSSAA